MEGFGGDPKAQWAENLFLEFLNTFSVDMGASAVSGEVSGRQKLYEAELESMRARESTTLYVDFSHVMQFDDTLQQAISDEFLRFEPYLRNACKRFVIQHKPSYTADDDPNKDVNLAFYNIPTLRRLRDLTTAEIGKLVAVSGVVTRTSEVRPELLQGTFKCLDCGGVIKNVDQQFKYTQPVICVNATCANRDRWALLRQESKFTDWQRVRMQETSKEIPAGSLPRSLDVILRHEIVEQARAGDKVIFTGTVVVIPDVSALASPGDKAEARREGPQNRSASSGYEGARGLKSLGVRDLSYRLAFIANSVQLHDKKRGFDFRGAKKDGEDDDTPHFTMEERDEIQQMRSTMDFFNKLVESLAPTVFGHQEVKRAVLLMLVGGVHKQTHEGINLRGDINVCIVGDPSCAKSQFLKYASSIVPRAVYTSGKSSSAAGLTATVVKEPETGEFCIEAGALMLADNGICCIDEFDKMDVKDQVAIHEAMEQQTISITKAGIQATLNARTSILAAANPTGGRYDKSKPLKYNVALPPPILSRFDLIYVMIDEPDDQIDHHIADHIVRVHQKHEEALSPSFTTAQIQRYMSYAKTIKPTLGPEARKVLVDAYVSLRRDDAAPGSRAAYRITYVCYPKVFFFLVSSSPVLVSTALLLGTLLSLGQPHIPQIDDLEEEDEEHLEVSSKALEDDEDDKKRSNNIKEISGDDLSQLQRTDDDDDADSVVTDVPVTKLSRRRFEEGIDDLSTRTYIDAETLLGRRTEIVETIEEEEEQFNVEDLDDRDDQIRNDALAENLDFIPTHKREVEKVAANEIKEAATVIDESNYNVEASLEKAQENMAHEEEISDKIGEEANLEGAEGHATECRDKKEETEMEDLAKSVNFSDTDTMIERSFEKPMKEIEEEMPLLDHPSSSTPEIHEEVFHLRTVDMDSSAGTNKSEGVNGKAEATIEDDPQAEVSDDVEENANKASLENLFKLELRSSWKRFAHRHSPSDSGSDAAESVSSDASLGQLDPMFDEHHPLLAYEGSKAGSVSNSSNEEGFNAEDFSQREMVSEGFIAFPNEFQAPSDVHEEDEEEEEEEVRNDFDFTWTEDDEKNLRDLGQSERERMQQEERLIADLHVQHPQGAEEENLIDFYSEERVSFIEEENLVEIGVAGETATEKAIAIHSESVDHQLEGQADSASKEIPLEACFDSASREIPFQVLSDSGCKEATTEVQVDQACKENPTELPEEKNLIYHLGKCMPNDLELLEDQSQPSGDACLDETYQELTHVEVSSVEETESASRNVIVEDTPKNHEQNQFCSPKDSQLSIETVEVAMQDFSTEFQIHGESIHTAVASIQEERSKSQKNMVLDDDLDSSSSSSDEIEMPAPETNAEESVILHEEFGVNSPKDSRHHSQDVEVNEMLSVHVTEIPRENIDTVAEVLFTEEHQTGEKEGKELSDNSSSSASEEIEMMMMEVMVEKSAIADEDLQVVSPKASLESTEMIETFSQDAPVAMEMMRDDLTTVAEEAFSTNQHEKMETVYDDSSSSASNETDLVTEELIAEKSSHKHDVAQVESLKAEEQLTETFEVIEKDSGLEIEAHRDMVSTEEQQPKEETIEKYFDDSSSSASVETGSTSSELIQEERPSKLEEIHDISPKISHGSTKIVEAVEIGSLPAVDMLGECLPTAEQKDHSEAQGSKLEEPKEASDNLGFSATNIAISENQGLIMLDVKSKEEIESTFEHVLSNEQDNTYEESHLVSPKANQESTATVEQVEQDSTLQINIPRDGFGEDASSEGRQPMPDETENTSDDSSSSASDISSFERLEELTCLEVNSKEQIEAALKEVIAEELAHVHDEVEASSSQASERPTETVEPTKLDSPPVIDMQRDISHSATVGTSSTEEHQSKPEKTEESCDDLNSAEMEVRKSPSSDGGKIQ